MLRWNIHDNSYHVTLGNQFELYTDHQSLKWLLTRTKEHSGRLWRRVDKIREFQFLVKHIPGRSNIVADALSWIGNIATQKHAHWNLKYIRQQQEACTTISQLKSLLQSKSRKIESTDMKLKAFEEELSKLFVRKDGVVCHYDKKNNIQIVIPRNLILRVLEMMHNQLGHLGFKKTSRRIKDVVKKIK